MEQVIKVRSKDTEVLYCLNRSSAAQSLYHQLPLRLKIEDYSHDEKIFYPKKLSIGNTAKANARKGTLAYYEPWGNVVLFYKDFGMAAGLYELGIVREGEREIESLRGMVSIEVVKMEERQ